MKLIVLAPGLNQNSACWKDFKEELSRDRDYLTSAVTWLDFDHGIRLWSIGNLDSMARRLRARIDARCNADATIDEVILIGHSIGGLLVRQAYLLAAGADQTDPQRPSAWAGKVSRIVLFAAINRGIDDRTGFWRKLAANLVRLSPLPFIFEGALQGSDFVTNLRVNWVRHFGRLLRFKKENAIPIVTQFLGDKDGVVRESDSVDVLAFPGSEWIRIANAEHGDLYRLDIPNRNERIATIWRAFKGTPARDVAVTDSSETRPARAVFLIHGIRASTNDDWVKRLTAFFESTKQVKVLTPEYGYFSAARFAFPSIRKKNVRRLQDAYSEAIAGDPNTEFDAVAHSNGTYMLYRTLERLPGVRFRNIYLAGCVLPTDTNWSKIFGRDQVSTIRNDRSNRDWPVALLCAALRGLFMKDVGTAGFDGFNGMTTKEVAFYPGRHAEALAENNVKNIGSFILEGKVSAEGIRLIAGPGYFRQLSRLMPFVAILTVGALIWVASRYLFHEGNFSVHGLLLVCGIAIAAWVIAEIS